MNFQLGLRNRKVLSLTVLAFFIFQGSPLLSQVVINEVLAKNTFTNLDDEGKARDWVEFRNLGGSAVNLHGFKLSDDPLIPERWTFPDITIPAQGFLLVWLSGEDRFVPPPDVVDASSGLLSFDPRYIKREETWKYLVPPSETGSPPAGWNDIGFDDRDWESGQSGFGYGDGDDFTELPQDLGVVFIRKEFNVNDPSALLNLVLKIDYDDGFIAYLNGERLASDGAPQTEPTFGTKASGKHEAGTARLFDFSDHLHLIQPGSNVLAIAGLNDTPSSDMSLIPELGVVPLVLHASFKLDSEDEETLTLYDTDGVEVDSIQLPLQSEDHSYGRAPDRGGDWAYFLTPTPEDHNSTRSFTEVIADKVEVSPAPGIYSVPSMNVNFSTSNAQSTQIRYTTDGTVPTVDSTLYDGPIRLSSNTTFRTAGFIEGERATRIISSSFFFQPRFTLPTMSISMDPSDYEFVHNSSGARGRGSEREAFIEFFDPEGQREFAHGLGLRLHGGAGRGGGFETKKSYKAYFRGVYGAKKLNYPIIPDTEVDVFDKLVLRAGFNDSFRTSGRAAYIRDQLIRDFHKDMGALVSDGSWCMLYVNQKLRGLFNIVERMDEEFLSSYFEGEDWDVIKTGNDVLVGSRDEWNNLRSFAVDNDLSNDVLYEQFLQMIDIENYTSYMILNMWCQNHDWPHNNWYAARERVPDGKWIFLSWDAEFGLGLNPGGYTADTFSHTLGRGGHIRDVLLNLLDNDKYRAFFIDSLERYLEGPLHPDNTIPRLEQLVDIVTPEMDEELEKFNRSVGSWQNNVNAIRTFLRERGDIFWDHVKNHDTYDFPESTFPTIHSFQPTSVVNNGNATIRIEGFRLRGTSVSFNGMEAAQVEYEDDAVIARLPLTSLLLGPVEVKVTSRESREESIAPRMLEVALPFPEIESVFPLSANAGETIFIQGSHFLEGAAVHFGWGNPSSDVQLNAFGKPSEELDELVVTVPDGYGSVNIHVVNNQPTSLASTNSIAFTYKEQGFIRADANVDGKAELTDAVFLLEHLFLGTTQPQCERAADVDGNDVLDLTDPISLLEHLFLGSFAVPQPFPACGPSAFEATLTCDTYEPCKP